MMKPIKTALGLMLLTAVSFTSCQNNAGNNASSGPGIEPLTNNTSAEKQQLFLRLVDENVTDSSVIYTAKSVFEKDTVGLKVEVLNNIKPGITEAGTVDEENGFVKGTIKISSIGKESDNLVKALGSIFKLPNSGEMTSAVILPTVFSSNKVPVDLTKSTTYSFKLFLENQQGAPAEVFAVVDTYRKAFEISEKDSTYRVQILSAFEGK